MIKAMDSHFVSGVQKMLLNLTGGQSLFAQLVGDHVAVDVKGTLDTVLVADLSQTNILPDTVIVAHGKSLGFASGETKKTVTHRNTLSFLVISLYTRQLEKQAFLAFFSVL